MDKTIPCRASQMAKSPYCGRFSSSASLAILMAMRRAIKPMERLAGLPGGPGARLCGDRKRYRGYFQRLRPFAVRLRE